MTEDPALTQELDERLLEKMPVEKLVILSLRQNGREHKAIYTKLDDLGKQIKELPRLKVELMWMKRIVIGGFLAAILLFLKQAVLGR